MAIPRSSRASIQTTLPRLAGSCRWFSNTHAVSNYDATLKNLKIGKHTRVIFQGFTGTYMESSWPITYKLADKTVGKQATANAKESIKWGTNIVGGVKPGREGEYLGRPVLPSVRRAMEVLKPDATGIYVAAHQATRAIEEAIEAEVPLIVAVAEHIPLHDFLRVNRTQPGSTLVLLHEKILTCA